MKMPARHALHGLLLLLCGFAFAQQPSAPVAMDIDAQRLDRALNAWARQTGFSIMISVERAAQGRMAPKVAGTYTPEESLRLLLAATDLSYEFVDARTVAIRAPKSSLETGADAAGLEPDLRLVSADERVEREQPQAGAAETNKDGGDSAEIVVTGTQLRGSAPVGSPLITVGRVEIDRSGAATVDQLLRTIPQNLASVDPSSMNTQRNGPIGQVATQNTAFGSTPNLHGLGLGTTLALVNGSRLAPGGVRGSVVDVSVIPLAAIERVEIVADGASAIYGADAVGGVVNFILRRDFEGAETSARYGSTSDGGGAERDFNQLAGANWSGGNVFASYAYSERDPILAGQRDFVTLSDAPGGARPGYFLFPDQLTHSGVVSLRHSLGSAVELKMMGNISDRRVRSSDVYGTDIDSNNIDQRDYGLGGGLDIDIARGWLASIDGQLYRSLQNYSGTTTFFGPFALDADTQLISGDVKIQGDLFTLPGGTVRGLLGGTFRHEDYMLDFPAPSALTADQFIDEDRRVESLYGEVRVPVLDSLTLSLAGRRDSYDGFGSTANPKFGVTWRLAEGLSVRASYGKSYRPPALYQTVDAPVYTYTLSVPDPSTGGESIALVTDAQSNPNLRPERSKSYSAGLDIEPVALPGVALSLTYFDIRYVDRLAPPTLANGGLFGFLGQPELADLIDRSPDVAAIQALMDSAIATGTYGDYSGPGYSDGQRTAADIEIFFDAGIQNLAATRIRGIDLDGRYGFPMWGGQADVTAGAAYLMELGEQNTPGGPFNDTAGSVFHSPDMRLRLGASWARAGFAGSVTFNHTDSFENPYVDPVEHVVSYRTLDLQLGYRISDGEGPGLLEGTRFTLNVSDLFNREPPAISNPRNAYNLGFDSSNASARGRFISLQIARDW